MRVFARPARSDNRKKKENFCLNLLKDRTKINNKMKILQKLKKLKSIHIVGVSGMEGGALAEFFASQGFRNLTFHDRAKRNEFAKAYKDYHDYQTEKEKEESIRKITGSRIKPGMTTLRPELNLGRDYLKDIEKADLIYVPSTWFRYEENDKLREIEGRIAFSSITELYFQIFGEKGIKTIGVTGTNGKSTTSRLIYQILKTGGKKTFLTGNDRENPPLLNKIINLKSDATIVMEIMNRQLIGLKYSPHLAVLTNIAPHHLDDHQSFADYMDVKKNIYRYQKKDDFSLFNWDNEFSRALAAEAESKTFYFSRKTKKCPGAYVESGEIYICEEEAKVELMPVKEISLLGNHNLENVLAAVLVGYIMQIERKKIRQAVKSFKPLKHRLEKVAEVDGVQYINDSESTNPASTVAALSAIKGKIVLIAGGRRIGATKDDYEEMVKKFFLCRVKAVLLIGEVASKIRNEFFIQKKKNPGLGPTEVKICKDLKEAVRSAKNIAAVGETILLSPGAESFGEFRDYRERGEKFKELIKNLKGNRIVF